MTLLLTLIRHAKSSWADADQTDFDRPLNDRGLKNAPMMGQRLKKIGWLPDLIVASPAVRTTMTAEAIAEAVGYPKNKIVWEKKIYAAPARIMLAEVVRHGAGHKHVAMVAHNPGTSQLADSLSDKPIGHVPTCGVVRLKFAGDAWEEISAGGELIDFDYPKR